MKRREWLIGVGSALLAGRQALADSGVVETSLSRNPRVRGGLGSTVEQAWPRYQANAQAVINDALTLTGAKLLGQDLMTRRAYWSLAAQIERIRKAKTPAEAGVEVVTIVARGDGGRLIPRLAIGGLEIPLPVLGVSWGDGFVAHGLVAFRRPGTYKAFALPLFIGEGANRLALRLLTWWDCGNSSVTFPKPQIERLVETRVQTQVAACLEPQPVTTPAEPTVISIERPVPVYVDRPVPGPIQVEVRTEYVDRWREIRLQTPPLPTQRVEIVPVILADSRRNVSGPGQTTAPPGQITVGPSWAVTAAATFWSTPKVTASGGPCPTPVTPPNPGTLPGSPPAVTPPATDTTLPANPGGVPPVSGADGAVNTPPASNPADFPPGSVVVPIASPGSAAANAANLLPG
jgi:hypothetical protein